MYPHYYRNSDQLSFTDDCINAGSDFDDFVEFPIIKEGVLAVGKRNSNTDVGTDRVVFRSKGQSASDFSWIYCGIMTHFSSVKVTATINGREVQVLPFQLC